LIERRRQVRDLIDASRRSTREPFQNWREQAAAVG
jgi:hypothetical protein